MWVFCGTVWLHFFLFSVCCWFIFLCGFFFMILRGVALFSIFCVLLIHFLMWVLCGTVWLSFFRFSVYFWFIFLCGFSLGLQIFFTFCRFYPKVSTLWIIQVTSAGKSMGFSYFSDLCYFNFNCPNCRFKHLWIVFVFLVVYRSRKLRPIIVDPGLYLMEKTGMFYATQKRELPNAFRLFTGLAFNIYAP